MTQDSRGMLPGHADFRLPRPAEPVRVNGRRPIPEVPRMNGHAEPAPAAADPLDVWDERVAKGLAFLRRRLAGSYPVDEFGFTPRSTAEAFDDFIEGHANGSSLTADRLAAAEQAILDGIRRVRGTTETAAGSDHR